MKRLVDYVDDDDDFAPLSIAPRVVQETSAPEVRAEQQVVAKVLHVEAQEFDKSFLREESKVQSRKKEKKQGDSIQVSDLPAEQLGNLAYHGPWAVDEEDEQDVERRAWQAELERRKRKAEQREAKSKATAEQKEAAVSAPMLDQDVKNGRFGSKVADYQGRSFLDPRRWPRPIVVDLEEPQEEVAPEVAEYLGKRQKVSSSRQDRRVSKLPKDVDGPAVREYIGHSMGINKVRLYGCLALTAGMDGRVMIWDTAHLDDISSATNCHLADERGAIQGYWGHGGDPVKDCSFPTFSAGSFVSGGNDGYACVWDTEKGVVITKLRAHDSRGATNAAKFRPNEDNQILTGCGDRRLRHWDIRQAGDRPAQVYDFHQSSVSSATFCENGNKFVSTSDDRRLVVWDWAVPAPVKTIAEVWLPAMPTTAAHPNSLSFVSVGLDDKLYMFRVNASTGAVKKAGEFAPEGFKVHGYSCEPCYSLDGRHLVCGDGSGDIVFLKINATSSSPVVQRIKGAHAVNTPDRKSVV